MIISKTPLRISFAGGGSDLPAYYEKFGGAVLSTSINKYIFLSMHPQFFRDSYFLKYSTYENVDSVDKIKHNIIREVFKLYGIRGVDFNSSADIPSGTGLGSSSSFTAGIISLCNAYVGKYMTKEDVAELACHVEMEILKEPIGKQDQYACAVGGLNYIEFETNGKVGIQKLVMNERDNKKLESGLMMFYTGHQRSASDILAQQSKNSATDADKIANLHKMVALAKDLYAELSKGNIDNMGEIMHTGWNYKKELASGISNDFINSHYETAMKNGAMGGKLLGAGGGGFLLFYVPQERQENVRKSLCDLREMPIKFDTSGTNIIYYNHIGEQHEN